MRNLIAAALLAFALAANAVAPALAEAQDWNTIFFGGNPGQTQKKNW